MSDKTCLISLTNFLIICLTNLFDYYQINCLSKLSYQLSDRKSWKQMTWHWSSVWSNQMTNWFLFIGAWGGNNGSDAIWQVLWWKIREIVADHPLPIGDNQLIIWSIETLSMIKELNTRQHPCHHSSICRKLFILFHDWDCISVFSFLFTLYLNSRLKR